MKLTGLSVNNFLGARSVEIELSQPITLFAGKNGAGKSSLQEAVRMALTGETVRVGVKKDYGQLVTEGAESGFAEVEIDGAVRAFVTLPDGKTTPTTEYVSPKALFYVLDAQRFARLDPNDRRAFLFGLMGLSLGREEVRKRLLVKECDKHKVEAIMPMLRIGLNAAHDEAKAKAREEKATWRALTGETYGDKKAATWQAKKPEFDSTAWADLPHTLSALDAELAATHQRMGALQADHKRYAEASKRLAELREKGSLYARIADKLERDQAELREWETKVATLKEFSLSQNARPCPDCGTMLALKEGVLVHAVPLEKGAEDDLGRLLEYEKAVRLLQSSVTNDERDLADADAAVKAITELEAALGAMPNESAIDAVRQHLDTLKAKRSAIAEKLAAHKDAERQAKQANERTAQALVAHESVLAWSAIADALAPDGIPGDMLSEALTPLNKRLEYSSQVAEWLEVHVEPDMSIWTGYPGHSARSYALLSESEQWRADAMLAEAIAHLSKIQLLVLDRFDVLDLKGREDLIAWLDILAQDRELDSALIFGTLKALPATLPETVAAHWLESGALVPFRAAA